MPATFPSHAGAVLPLKLWRPRWFDGVALVLGAASPDLAYLVDGSGLPVWPLSHEWPGLFLFCLPVTLFGVWLVRRTAPGIAANLPLRPRWLALRDYGSITRAAHPLPITALSALLGAASHIVLDVLVDARPAEWPSHLIGALVVLAVAIHIGRRRLLITWYGPPPERPRKPLPFWTTAGATMLAGALLVPWLPAAFLPHTTGVRLLTAAALALLAGSAAANLSARSAAGLAKRSEAGRGRLSLGRDPR